MSWINGITKPEEEDAGNEDPFAYALKIGHVPLKAMVMMAMLIEDEVGMNEQTTSLPPVWDVSRRAITQLQLPSWAESVLCYMTSDPGNGKVA